MMKSIFGLLVVILIASQHGFLAVSVVRRTYTSTGCMGAVASTSSVGENSCRQPVISVLMGPSVGLVKGQEYRSYMALCSTASKIRYYVDDMCNDFLVDSADDSNCDDYYANAYSFQLCCSTSGTACDISDGPTVAPTTMPTPPTTTSPTTSPTIVPTESPSAGTDAEGSLSWAAGLLLVAAVNFVAMIW